jgi:hypothetical protein
VTYGRSVVFSGSSNKTYLHNITEILLKVVLNTINLNHNLPHVNNIVVKSIGSFYC